MNKDQEAFPSRQGQPERGPLFTCLSTEAADLKKLLENYKDTLGDFYLIEVEGAGFIIQSTENVPGISKDWFFVDYDDTLVATTGVKSKRHELFLDYLHEHIDPNIDIEDSKKIMDVTDKFARWAQEPGRGDMYNPAAHIVSLSWTVIMLSQTPPEARKQEMPKILERLKATKAVLDAQVENSSVETPFYFDQHTRKLIATEEAPWSTKIEQVMDQSIIHPPQYEETIEAAKILRGTGFNIGVFTYGEQYFQLRKVLELLKAHPQMGVSQIWLSYVSKGDFIEKSLQTEATKRASEHLSKEQDRYIRDLLIPRLATPLGYAPQIIVFFDDNPRELDAVEGANKLLIVSTGSKFQPVRSLRVNTREEQKPWDEDKPKVDTRVTQFSGQQIADFLNKVRTRAWQERLRSAKTYYLEKAPIERAIDGVIRARGFTLITVGTDLNHTTHGLPNGADLDAMASLLGKSVTVLEDGDVYQYMYLEDEDQSFFTTKYTGTLTDISASGIKVSCESQRYFEKRSEKVRGGDEGTEMMHGTKGLFIPFFKHEYGYRSITRLNRILEISAEDARLEFPHPYHQKEI